VPFWLAAAGVVSIPDFHFLWVFYPRAGWFCLEILFGALDREIRGWLVAYFLNIFKPIDGHVFRRPRLSMHGDAIGA